MIRMTSSNKEEKLDFSLSSLYDFLEPTPIWAHNKALKPAVWIDHEPRSATAAEVKPEWDAGDPDWVASSWHESSWSLLHGLDVIDPVPPEHLPAAWLEKVRAA
jgi:hypothetical protein